PDKAIGGVIEGGWDLGRVAPFRPKAAGHSVYGDGSRARRRYPRLGDADRAAQGGAGGRRATLRFCALAPPRRANCTDAQTILAQGRRSRALAAGRLLASDRTGRGRAVATCRRLLVRG